MSSLVALLGSSSGDNLKATAASTLARLLRASPPLMGALLDKWGAGVILSGAGRRVSAEPEKPSWLCGGPRPGGGRALAGGLQAKASPCAASSDRTSGAGCEPSQDGAGFHAAEQRSRLAPEHYMTKDVGFGLNSLEPSLHDFHFPTALAPMAPPLSGSRPERHQQQGPDQRRQHAEPAAQRARQRGARTVGRAGGRACAFRARRPPPWGIDNFGSPLGPLCLAGAALTLPPPFGACAAMT